jgi:hypothetical protein
MKSLPNLSSYGKGDVLVLFGELFQRGYATGLVEAAEKKGMTIVRSTVGRREKTGELRALDASEFPTQPFINVPLEAGFDMEVLSKGGTLCDQLKDVKLSDWQSFQLNPADFEEAKNSFVTRFQKNVQQFMTEVKAHLPKGKKVLFAHLMAGGVPRAKIIMPLMNRVFKGEGDRHIPSEHFWNSSIGKFCELNFNEVTANTFKYLVNGSAQLRQELIANGGEVSYLAYGYHGTEVLINGQYQWQTYTPYVQGHAKMKLEDLSIEFTQQGLKTCVYNCPEILTNSSSIFIGVELSLYPLFTSLENKVKSLNTPNAAVYAAKLQKVKSDCEALLNTPQDLMNALKIANDYLSNPLNREFCKFPLWPQHNRQDQMEFMLQSSDKITSLHKELKNLITSILSEVVFSECGKIMLHESYKPRQAVAWLGHDVLAESFVSDELA